MFNLNQFNSVELAHLYIMYLRQGYMGEAERVMKAGVALCGSVAEFERKVNWFSEGKVGL